MVSGVCGTVDMVGRCDLACKMCDERWALTVLVKTGEFSQRVGSRYDSERFVFPGCKAFKPCRGLDCIVEDCPFAY